MSYFKAIFKISNAGGIVEAKPKELKGLLIEALALKLSQEIRHPKVNSICLSPREDLHTMIQSITVEPMSHEEVKERNRERR